MTGPETVYAAMTSGDVGAVNSVQDGVEDAMRSLQDDIALIRYAADKPNWESPTARTRFNMRAWTTRAAAEVAYIRLNRVSLALQRVAVDYTAMDNDATDVIHAWRTRKKEITDPLSLLLLRASVMSALDDVRVLFDTQLGKAQDFVQADPLTSDQEKWLENGMARSMRRDLEHPGSRGPIIPGTLATGDDDGSWTPQGLGYDPTTGQLLQTSYGSDGTQLSVVDPDTGELVNHVALDQFQGRAPDHAGGVAVHDGSVWVTSSEVKPSESDPSGAPPMVYQYSMADIASAAPGDRVPVLGTPMEVPAAAYSTIVGNTMYVGSFDETDNGSLYTYSYDKRTGSWGNEQGPFPTPPQTQGIAVRGNEVVFSTSWGRDKAGSLQSYNLGDVLGGGDLGDPVRTVELPNMAEGVAALPDGLATTFESGSSGYVDPQDNPLEELWASMNMTVTPYDDLGLAGIGFEVEPVTLKQAAAHFDEVETGLSSAAKRIAGLDLPSGCLGHAAGAAPFCSALNQHCNTTSSRLEDGRLSATITASGLISAAEGYEDSDSGSRSLFDRLTGLLP